MYSKKAQKELVNLLEKLKGEKDIDNIVFSLFERNPAVLTAIDEKTDVSFFAALVSLGYEWLVYNAIRLLCTQWDDMTKKNFNLAFQMDKNGAYPLDRAYMLDDQSDRYSIIKQIMEKGNRDIGFAAINHFIKNDKKQELKLIFRQNEEYNRCRAKKSKISFNGFNHEGKTFLMVAAEFDAVKCANYLIAEDLGVQLDLQNKEGESALSIAKMMGSTRVAEYLQRQLKRIDKVYE